MFCPKCGTQVLDDAGFCQKCGAKIVYEGTASKAPDTHTAESLPETPTASNTVSDGSDFKTFVDNHVRSSTQFQSAEELLNSPVSLQFVWICLGISVVLGVWMPPILLITIPLGYAAAKVVGGIKKGRYASKFRGQIDGKVDTDNLIQFLNTHLNYLQPYFHDWGYIKRKKQNLLTTSAGETLQTLAEALAHERTKQVSLCTDFGLDKRCLSMLLILVDLLEKDSEKMIYVADAGGRIESEGVAFLSNDFGCLRNARRPPTLPADGLGERRVQGIAETPCWGGSPPSWVGQASRPAIRRPHSPGPCPGIPLPPKGERRSA